MKRIMVVGWLLGGSASLAGFGFVPDPSGDALPNPPPLAQQLSLDLNRVIGISLLATPDFIFSLRFDQRIHAPSETAAFPNNRALTARTAVGFVEIDLDGDSATGVDPRQNAMSPPLQSIPLGVDGWLDLASEATNPGFARFVLPGGWPGADGAPFEMMVEVDYRYRSVHARFDLSAVPGAMIDLLNPPRFTAIVGNPLNVTDALNFAGTAAFIPSPGAAALAAVAGAACGRRRRPRACNPGGEARE